MKTLETEKATQRFEDFMPKDGDADIFQKVNDLTSFVAENPQECLDGLGLQVLGAADHSVRLREPNQQDRDVIMLGSNSYLFSVKW